MIPLGCQVQSCTLLAVVEGTGVLFFLVLVTASGVVGAAVVVGKKCSTLAFNFCCDMSQFLQLRRHHIFFQKFL